jgi:hypothetical protein
VADLVAGEIVVFQKIWGPNADALRDALRPDTTTVYAQADLVPDNPLPLRCDAVVASSRALAAWHEERGMRAWHIPDPAEVWLDPRPERSKVRVRICWIAHRKNLETLEPLRALLAEPELAAYELVTVSNDSAADVLWSEDSVRRVLAASDVGVVPVRDAPGAAMASANRLTSLMAAGLPVLADRLPSYEEIVDAGHNAFLCDGTDDWRRGLRELLDPARRVEVGRAARATVDPAFRPETTGDAWIRVFDQLGGEPVAARRPRLRGYAQATASATYARAALDRNYGLPTVLGQAASAVLAPRTVPSLWRDLARPIAGRVRAAVARRL